MAVVNLSQSKAGHTYLLRLRSSLRTNLQTEGSQVEVRLLLKIEPMSVVSASKFGTS
jgi:hypothetical protein